MKPPQSTPRARQGGLAFWRLLKTLCLMALLLCLGAAGSLWWWSGQPLPLRQPVVDLSIERGQNPRQIAQGWVDAGIDTSPWLLYQWFRWSGQASKIKAGGYEGAQGVTPASLLNMLVQGDESLATVKLIEGWTFARWRQELAKAPGLNPDTAGMTEAQIMQALDQPSLPAEGRFFPDTYAYAKGSSDLAVMRRALAAMRQQVDRAWALRTPDSVLRDRDQLLILASIIEKETGHPEDRAHVSGVFHNRLRIGMRLQTDPTVIYGMGERFDGNLRRADLQTDTPFNTYTRAGLPPTPIAMPGKASLITAAQPADTRALYFVAKGGGRSVFSENLNDHNRAVNRYQRNPSNSQP